MIGVGKAEHCGRIRIEKSRSGEEQLLGGLQDRLAQDLMWLDTTLGLATFCCQTERVCPKLMFSVTAGAWYSNGTLV